MKISLDKIGVSNYRLLDGVGAIAGYLPDKTARPGNREVLEAMRPAFARDGVHLSGVGLQCLSKTTLVTIKHMLNQNTAQSTVSGMKRFFWRGFSSVRGSSTRKAEGGGQEKKKRLQRLHPYWGKKKQP